MKKLVLISFVFLLVFTQVASAIFFDMVWIDDASDAKTVMQGIDVTFEYDAFTTSGINFGEDHTVETTISLYTQDDPNNAISVLVEESSLYGHYGEFTLSTDNLADGTYVIHGVSYDLDDVVNGQPLSDADVLYVTVLEPNEVPQILNVYIKPSEPYTTDDLVGYCQATDVNDDAITYEGQWIRNGEFYESVSKPAVNQGQVVAVDTLESDLTSPGDQWVFACRAFDGELRTAYEYSEPVTILAVEEPNDAPTITSLYFQPQAPTSDDNLAGFCKAYDPDGDLMSIDYQWFKNGVAYSDVGQVAGVPSGYALSLGTYYYGHTSEGDVWEIRCTASDGELSSEEAIAQVTILPGEPKNHAPDVEQVYITPHFPHENSDLLGFCEISDSDYDDLYYIWGWYKNGHVVKSGISPRYAPGQYAGVQKNLHTLDAAYTAVGDEFTFACQAYDGDLYSDEVRSAPVIIQEQVIPNTPPAIQSVTIEPQVPYTADNLSGFCKAVDTEDDELVYDYQWNRNGQVFLNGNTSTPTPSGETIATEMIFSSDTTADDVWSLRCRAYDGEYFSVWMHAAVVIKEVVPENRAPKMQEVFIDPSKPVEGDLLDGYCRATDGDGDDVSYEYKWIVNGDHFQDGNTAFFSEDTLVLVDTAGDQNHKPAAGSEWILGCRARDQQYISSWMYSEPVVIQEVVPENRAPVIQEVLVTPQTPFSKDDLDGFCRASDADGDDVKYEFLWYRNGGFVSGMQGFTDYRLQDVLQKLYTVDSTKTVVGESWKMKCRAYDGQDYSPWAASNVVVIDEEDIDHDPVMEAAYIEPAAPYTEDNLEAFCRASDVDGDQIQYKIKWFKNGVFQDIMISPLSAEGETVFVGALDNALTSVDEEWYFTCYALTLNGQTVTLDSNKVIIQEVVPENRAPVMQEAEIRPWAPTEDNDLTGFCRASDVDGDDVSYEFIWLQNAANFASGSTSAFSQNALVQVSTVAASQTVKGDSWKIGCRAFDGELYSDWLYSAPVHIQDDGCADDPQALLFGTQHLYVGETGNYDASHSIASDCGVITNYAWTLSCNNNPVASAGGASPYWSYTFTQAGDCEVNVMITDQDGKRSNAVLPVYVQQPYVPAPTAIITAPMIVDVDESFQVSGQKSYAPSGETLVSYKWSVQDANGLVFDTFTGAWNLDELAAEGTYTYTLTVTASNGETDTATHTITVIDGGNDDDSVTSYSGLKIASYTLYGHDIERVAPGEVLIVRAKVENMRSSDIENLRMTVLIPEFGVRYKTGAIDLDPGDSEVLTLKIDVPEYIDYGYYYPELSFTSDDVKRVKFGYLEVTES